MNIIFEELDLKALIDTDKKSLGDPFEAIGKKRTDFSYNWDILNEKFLSLTEDEVISVQEKIEKDWKDIKDYYKKYDEIFTLETAAVFVEIGGWRLIWREIFWTDFI